MSVWRERCVSRWDAEVARAFLGGRMTGREWSFIRPARDLFLTFSIGRIGGERRRCAGERQPTSLLDWFHWPVLGKVRTGRRQRAVIGIRARPLPTKGLEWGKGPRPGCRHSRGTRLGPKKRRSPQVASPTFITLGPADTRHENALRRCLEFQGLTDARVELVPGFDEGLERVREEPNTFLVQCSAHPDATHPKSLGIVPAALGYPDLTLWESIVQESANPIRGKQSAGRQVRCRGDARRVRRAPSRRSESDRALRRGRSDLARVWTAQAL